MGNVNKTTVRLGDLLKEYGYVTEQQVQAAADWQKSHKGVKFGTALMELGYITEDQMLQALAQRLNLPVVDLSLVTINVEAMRKIPRQLAEKYCMIAVGFSGNTLEVATNDPVDFYALEDVQQVTGMQLDIQIAKKVLVERAIRYYYAEVDALTAASRANTTVEETPQVQESEDDESVVSNLLTSLIRRAYSTGASDIHIEPFETETTVRMRIDGMIVTFMTLKRGLHAPLIARIKVLGELDIAEKRIPQDGHFFVMIGDEKLNMRVSLIPTVFGEKAVLRLLSSTGSIDHSGTFGMTPDNYRRFQGIIHRPNGIVYLTGPTGSGKTTTLYMILEELAQQEVNICTIEDPVEKNLNGINQMQVNTKAGLTFESGLRALLRQDPDIIMVGETRDNETALISARAAITGHLVFSTLHTNDTASSVARLIDMGVEPYMVASSVVGIVAQRLMRKVCPECGRMVDATPEQRARLKCGPVLLRKTVGCSACNHTGYHGRIAVHEIMSIDQTLRQMISDHATTDEIRTYAIAQQGMQTIWQAGRELVLSGQTTYSELEKIAYDNQPTFSEEEPNDHSAADSRSQGAERLGHSHIDRPAPGDLPLPWHSSNGVG